jgi:hypothetical protein
MLCLKIIAQKVNCWEIGSTSKYVYNNTIEDLFGRITGNAIKHFNILDIYFTKPELALYGF